MRWAKKWGEVESGWAKQGKEGGGCEEEKNHLAFAPPPSSLFFHTGSQLNLFPLHAFRNECLHCKLKQILWDGITNRPPKKRNFTSFSNVGNWWKYEEFERATAIQSKPWTGKLRCVLLAVTLHSSVQTGIRTGEFNAGGSPAKDYHPIQGRGGEYKYSQSIHATETKLRPDGVLGSYADFTVIPNSSYLILWDKNTTFLIDLQEQDGNKVILLCVLHT